MNTNRNTLALRRYSIRTLTHSELSVVHGGKGNGITTNAGNDTRTKLA